MCIGHRDRVRPLGIVGDAWKILEGDHMVGKWSDIEGGDQGHRNKKMS